MKYDVYCDGGCRGNGKEDSIGAYAIIVVPESGEVSKVSDGKRDTTNNEMELMGLLGAIRIAKSLLVQKDNVVEIFCDSAYSLNIATDWMFRWAANGWTKKGGEIKNLEIIKAIYDELNFYSGNPRIKYTKVKGHAGIKYNEMADKVLNDYMDNALKLTNF